jgi:hypothetical protein
MPRSWPGVACPGANAPRCTLFVRARRESRNSISLCLHAAAFRRARTKRVAEGSPRAGWRSFSVLSAASVVRCWCRTRKRALSELQRPDCRIRSGVWKLL